MGKARRWWTVGLGAALLADAALFVAWGKPTESMSMIARAAVHIWPALAIGICWSGRMATTPAPDGKTKSRWRAVLAFLLGIGAGWFSPLLAYSLL